MKKVIFIFIIVAILVVPKVSSASVLDRLTKLEKKVETLEKSKCKGQSRVSSWENYGTGNALKTTIDISHCGFSENITPIILSNVSGTSNHWDLLGVNSIYSPSSQSFEIYIKYAHGHGNVREDATTSNWVFHWVAIIE